MCLQQRISVTGAASAQQEGKKQARRTVFEHDQCGSPHGGAGASSCTKSLHSSQQAQTGSRLAPLPLRCLQCAWQHASNCKVMHPGVSTALPHCMLGSMLRDIYWAVEQTWEFSWDRPVPASMSTACCSCRRFSCFSCDLQFNWLSGSMTGSCPSACPWAVCCA